MEEVDFNGILTDSSRSLADYTAAMVGTDERSFARLLELSIHGKYPFSMRAARVADLCSEHHPELIRPHLLHLFRTVPGLTDMSVKRILLHILTRHSWVDDEEAMGRLVDTLFRWLEDDSQSIAVKAYSMVILENITRVEPDLKAELILVLGEILPLWESTAMRTSGKKLLKRLMKGQRTA